LANVKDAGAILVFAGNSQFYWLKESKLTVLGEKLFEGFYL